MSKNLNIFTSEENSEKSVQIPKFCSASQKSNKLIEMKQNSEKHLNFKLPERSFRAVGESFAKHAKHRNRFYLKHIIPKIWKINEKCYQI